jgi:hypothetical protein
MQVALVVHTPPMNDIKEKKYPSGDGVALP